jgi:hypothetical protein
MGNINLLKILGECEYPGEFLVARLRGKKGGLFRNWEFLITSNNPLEKLQDSPFYPYLRKYAAAGIWRFLRNEHLWVYKRMNQQQRDIFGPYFAYHEINTLIKSLRCISRRNENANVAQHLHGSLLHSDIQKVLIESHDFKDMLTTLESLLSERSEIFRGLRHYYEKNGFHALEPFLRQKLLTYILFRNKSPMLKTFLQYMVDFNNSISLAKNIRWQTELEPVFISGGTIDQEKLKRANMRKDLQAIIKLFPLSGMKQTVSSATELETLLLGLITKELRRWSYEGTIAGNILFYLWEQFRYTRNISLVLHAIQLEDEDKRISLIA